MQEVFEPYTIYTIMIGMAFIMEIVDSSLGMMYGTLLSPILIGLGFEPLYVVPAILISQSIGGMSGTAAHHKFKNADFNGATRDMKVALAMIIPGLLVVGLGVFMAVSLPKLWIKSYIATVVIIMSVLCLAPFQYKFAWWKQYVIGILAAFNKAMTGGGFGPVTSTGGIIGGLTAKVSIATTTFAEVWICMAAFIVYVFMKPTVDISMVITLTIGAAFGGFIGPYISSIVNHRKLRMAIGWLGIGSGIWLFWKILM